MSARLGTPTEVNLAVGAVGGSFTRTLSVPSGGGPAILNMLSGTWTASAGAGSRQLAVQVKDAVGNILITQPVNAIFGATGVGVITAGMGSPVGNTLIGSTTYFTVPIPGELSLPAGATFGIIDLASISATDTLSLNAILVY